MFLLVTAFQKLPIFIRINMICESYEFDEKRKVGHDSYVLLIFFMELPECHEILLLIKFGVIQFLE